MVTKRRMARLDRLSSLVPPRAETGPTLGETLDAVRDPEARRILAECVVQLFSGTWDQHPVTPERACAAEWLYRALFSDSFGHDPSSADLETLIERRRHCRIQSLSCPRPT